MSAALLTVSACEQTPTTTDGSTSSFSGYRVSALPAGQGATLTAVPRDASTVVNVPSAIPGDGSVDVTGRLQTFLNGVPNGSTIVFPAGARYRLDGTWLFQDRNDLTIVGNGAQLFTNVQGTAKRTHVRLMESSNITITGLKIRGARTADGIPTGGVAIGDLQWQFGISMHASSNVVIERVEITDVWGDFVYMGREGERTRNWTQNVVVRNNTFARASRQGVAFTGVRNATVANNTISDVSRATLDFEPDGTVQGEGVDNIAIVNNVINRGKMYFVAAAGRWNVDNVTLAGNTLRDKKMIIWVGERERATGLRRNWRIVDNTTDLTETYPTRAINLYRATGAVIERNRIPFKSSLIYTPAGVLDDAGCGNAVRSNEFTGATVHHRVVHSSCATTPETTSRTLSYEKEPAGLRTP